MRSHSQSQQLSSMLGFRAAAQTIAGCFLLFWTFSKCPSSGQGGENQKLQGPPQLPDSPDLFGYWLSQGSAGALRVGKSSLKILLCLMGKNTAPTASTAVEIRASEWQPTSLFLPGESQGWGSLVGCRLWGSTESNMTEAT